MTNTEGTRTYTVTLPDGTTATRSTKRTYTHVVIVKSAESGEWGDWTWSGSEANAEKAARQYRGWGHTEVFVQAI